MRNRKFYTCCISGHRPNGLPWKYDEKDEFCRKIKNILREKFENAITMGYVYFICGMALGIDLISGELIVELKNKYKNIKLECAIPCINQNKYWTDEYTIRYNNVLNNADKITLVSNKQYFDGCMQLRNKYMVDNSNLLIAVFNNKPSGTKSTIEYAIHKQINLEIIYI